MQTSSGRVLSAAVAALAGALLLGVGSTGHASPAVKGTGGSTAARVIAQWNFQYGKETKTAVGYAPANSAVGIREMIARNVDFGATEIPLSAEDLKKNDLIQFPLLIGAAVVAVNIPGVEAGALRLDSGLLSRIYLGEIKVWSDNAIRAANPALNLPKLPIKLVVRDTSASTTLALTTFLAHTDRAWAARIGANAQPTWPAPTLKVRSVQAMSETVQSTPGAIGYLSIDEAARNKLAYVQLRNRAGQYVKPSHDSIVAAVRASGFTRASDQIPNLFNADGAGSWPMIEVTYVLLDRRPKDAERARTTLRFFYWVFMQGDDMAAETGFVPLPSAMQARVVGRFRDVLGPNQAPLDFLQ